MEDKGSGARSKISLINGTVMVIIKRPRATRMLTFNCLLEKTEYEKSGRYKLLKEKAITKI